MKGIRDLLNLSYVQRWVIAPMHRPQSVAEHSFRVAVIVLGLHRALVDLGHTFILEHAMRHALVHDADEVYTGDVPGTHKDAEGKEWPYPSSLTLWEIAVKVADSLETWDWWRKHGDTTWNHPNSPMADYGQRDIRKILHYTQEWSQMRMAAKKVMVEAMGHEEYVIDALFRKAEDAQYAKQQQQQQQQ